MKVSFARTRGETSHTVYWTYKGYTLTYNIQLSYDLSNSFTITHPAVVAVNYDNLAKNMIAQMPCHVKKEDRKKLVEMLYEEVPGSFTIGGS